VSEAWAASALTLALRTIAAQRTAQVAARFGALDALRALIELGANLEAKDARSKTALQVGRDPGHLISLHLATGLLQNCFHQTL
jgi:hypothetical protein